MPDPDDDFEARLTVLEREVARLRAQTVLISSDAAIARLDAVAARVLAAGADRDVSEVRAELRAHIQALNALRETQLEQAREMREGFAEMRERFAEMRGDLAEVREGFAKQAIGMAEITAAADEDRGTRGSSLRYHDLMMRTTSATPSGWRAGPATHRCAVVPCPTTAR